jgi:hypothetical protein
MKTCFYEKIHGNHIKKVKKKKKKISLSTIIPIYYKELNTILQKTSKIYM